MSFKVAVTDYIEENLDWEAQKCAELGLTFSAHQLKYKAESEIIDQVADAHVIVVNMMPVTESIVSQLSNCKLIIRHGIGYDNIDVNACTAHDIQLAYYPEYCKEDVAEHAITLIFAVARRLHAARKVLEESSRTGQWDFSTLFPIYRLTGKTLGIFGLGSIGSLVYQKIKDFGFRILGCDPFIGEACKATMDQIEWVDRETLLRESDYVTLHTPLTEETRHLINAEALELMKPSAYVINTSRAGMIDTAALIEAIKGGKIAGAGIDVFEQEPPPLSLELFQLDHVVLTPHMAWASEEAGWHIRESIIADIVAAYNGQNAKHIINEIRR